MVTHNHQSTQQSRTARNMSDDASQGDGEGSGSSPDAPADADQPNDVESSTEASSSGDPAVLVLPKSCSRSHLKVVPLVQWMLK